MPILIGFQFYDSTFFKIKSKLAISTHPKTCRKQQRAAQAPVHDAQGVIVKDKLALTALWVQQSSEESWGNVVGVSQSHAHRLLAERRLQELLQHNSHSFHTTKMVHVTYTTPLRNGPAFFLYKCCKQSAHKSVTRTSPPETFTYFVP